MAFFVIISFTWSFFSWESDTDLMQLGCIKMIRAVRFILEGRDLNDEILLAVCVQLSVSELTGVYILGEVVNYERALTWVQLAIYAL